MRESNPYAICVFVVGTMFLDIVSEDIPLRITDIASLGSGER